MNHSDRPVINFILRTHPLGRLLIALACAAVIFFVLRGHERSDLIVFMCAWCMFSFTYLLMSWVIIFFRDVDNIRRIARIDDGSRWFVALLIFVSSISSLVIVLILVTGRTPHLPQMLFVGLSILSVMFSWIMVHTALLFHYAYEYYDHDPSGINEEKGGLVFPDDAKPNYLDFAYFSFVIGMTFQVSDVQITVKKIRKLALLHGLLAFGLNTFVLALTINLIAGLSK